MRRPARVLLFIFVMLFFLYPAAWAVEPATNPIADNALRPRIIPPTPSAYDATPQASLATWVAKVNGDPISLAFFSRRMATKRAAAYQHYAAEAGATPGAAFWTTPIRGETPAQWLKQRTLEECLRIQIELGLAKHQGLLPDTGYGTFLKALDTENERRRAALAKGEPIYGVQQYGEEQFFTYVMNNLRVALQQKLATTELAVTEEELRAQYEAKKDEYFNRGFRVKVWAIEILTGTGEGQAGGYTAEAAKAKITEAKQRLAQGERFEEVAAAYNENGELHEQVFDFESRSLDKTRRATMREEAMRLKEGEISEIFQEMNGYYLILCVEKDTLSYRPFEEVKEMVARLTLQQRYETLLDWLVKTATVKVNQAVLEGIEVQ